jgi:hypothetical protein
MGRCGFCRAGLGEVSWTVLGDVVISPLASYWNLELGSIFDICNIVVIMFIRRIAF